MPLDPSAGFASLFGSADFELGSGLWTGVTIIYETSFVWLPAVLTGMCWKLWITWKQAAFIAAQKSTLLEVVLPQEVYKSPAAMELFITSLYQTGGEGTWIDRLIKGKSRPWFSLELVSLEGKIRFYIWTRPAWKNHIESQLYAQFQGTEIYEVPDYSLPVSYDPEAVAVWGCEFKLNKADPYPIKTYLDYDMKAAPVGPGSYSTAHAVDPMSSSIEYLGSLGPGEQVWMQIIIRAHKKDRKKAGKWFEKADWKEDLSREVKKLREKEKDGGRLSPAEGEAIEAMERSVSKFPFETGIRTLYIAKKENFNPIRISGLTGSFRQYNSNNLNGFSPTRTTSFDYPWQDYKDMRLNGLKRRILDAYKRRSYFYSPYKKPHFILNTEEIATIYHLPSLAVMTPSLVRASSKKGEPPSNLPF